MDSSPSKTKGASWMAQKFQPLPMCNTYSLHILETAGSKYRLKGGLMPIVVDIDGLVHWFAEDDVLHHVSSTDLKPQLNREDIAAESALSSVELVASDISPPMDDAAALIYLATCWIEYDELFSPAGQFAVFFRISLQKEAEMWKKIDLLNAPTYTRLTTTSPLDTGHRLYWLIWSYNRSVQAFDIDHKAARVTAIENIGDAFPVLEIGACPGTTTRSDCWIAYNYRFSAVGYDTGYVVASVCKMKGTIVDRKAIKFRGPISVLRLIDDDADKIEGEGIRTPVLLSSTLGPAALWYLTLREDETLQWEMKCELLDSEAYDTVVCAGLSHTHIFIGTFAEHILIYPRVKLEHGSSSMPPLTCLLIGAPALSIFHSKEENFLLILTSKGLHRYLAMQEENSGAANEPLEPQNIFALQFSPP